MRKFCNRKVITVLLAILLAVIYLLPYRAYHVEGSYPYEGAREYELNPDEKGNYEESKRIFYRGEWYDLSHTGVIDGYPTTFYDSYKDESGNLFWVRRDSGEIVRYQSVPDKETEENKQELENPEEFIKRKARSYLVQQVGPIHALYYQMTVSEYSQTLLPEIYAEKAYQVRMSKKQADVNVSEYVVLVITSKGTVVDERVLEVGTTDFSIVTKLEMMRAEKAIIRKMEQSRPSAVAHTIHDLYIRGSADRGLICYAGVTSQWFDENGELTDHGMFAHAVAVEFLPKTLGIAVVLAFILVLWVPSGLAWAFGRINRKKL